MDTDSDAEPPVKVAKPECITPSRYKQLEADHLAVLDEFAFSEYKTDIRLEEVPNKLILALLFFDRSIWDIREIVKKMLGLPLEEKKGKEYAKFQRKLTEIKKESKQEKKKRDSDKFSEFCERKAFDKAFFEILDNEKCKNSNIPNNFLTEKNSIGVDSVSDSLGSHDNETQTDPVDLSSSENIIFQYQELKKKYKNLQKTLNALTHWKVYNKKLISSARLSNKALKKANVLDKNKTKLLEKKSTKLAAVERELREKEELLHEALTKLGSVSNIVELKEDGKSFSNETWKAVITLKSLGVSDGKVGEVIKTVADLVHVQLDDVPSASTCRNYALSALNLSKTHISKQLSTLIDNGEFVCLASDETTKGTVKLQAFGVHTSDGKFTCIGIEPVAEKSAQTALNALENTISQMPEASPNFFKQFLVSVRSTISDSARTEIKLNELLVNARKKAVPEIVADYDKLTKDEKAEFTYFSQYFCQLHVISNYTNVVLKTLLEHELGTSKGLKIGEPSVFTLIKNVSQLFGQRGSGLHGILQMWSAWCEKYQINRFTFPSFIGNRFNILFVIASRVFFHRYHLIEFIKECDCSKTDLRATRDLLENDIIVEHLHVLGLLDQLVTGPLWRMSECCDHVLDTCQYARQLKQWFEDCSLFPVSFFDGSSPTPSLQVNSPTNSVLLLQALLNRDPTDMSSDVVTLICGNSLDYFSRAFAPFLTGGEYCDDTDLIKRTTGFAPATNRDIEAVFGLMSHFFDSKPNMRIDVRVAFTLLKKNHTLAWLQKLPIPEQEKILNESRSALKQLRDAAHSRQIAINTVILRLMKEKNLQSAKRQAKELKDRCKYTKEILSLGFWQNSDEIKTGLSKLSEKEKILALSSQLKFRKFVIKQSAPSSSFTVSANSKALSVDELVVKLEALIGGQQYAQQLLLMDHAFVGKKFFESTTKKSGFVADIRIVGGLKTVTLQYDDGSDPRQFDFSSFQSSVDNGSFTMH
ncbi:hypothetical protein B9Z55_008868 [Caenorhabditis nigoni]|uniref:Uncharacterized protein n=1 Tax=Caenorhabditis nigoni TaxID=1611254 RepID=A0A2G5UPH7_9PELO|nr:hypothetical protein B9Z55_008868 [Caenorhabditis nigoni]